MILVPLTQLQNVIPHIQVQAGMGFPWDFPWAAPSGNPSENPFLASLGRMVYYILAATPKGNASTLLGPKYCGLAL